MFALHQNGLHPSPEPSPEDSKGSGSSNSSGSPSEPKPDSPPAQPQQRWRWTNLWRTKQPAPASAGRSSPPESIIDLLHLLNSSPQKHYSEPLNPQSPDRLRKLTEMQEAHLAKQASRTCCGPGSGI